MREIQTKMTFKRKNCRWLPAFEIDRRHELGSMIFSVVGRMTSGILGIALFAATSMPAFAQDDDAFHYNRVLGRGINLGNALEAPQEGAWGVTLEADYFRLIKEAGFNSVRIPIRWSAHASTAAPYDIETDFFQRVDWAIGQALSRNLAAVINVHHYEEMNQDPVQNLPRLVELWKQIARRYQNQPKSLMFELLNEPHDRLDDERWQDAFPQLLKAIRDSNPDRIILIGPAYWNAVDRLDKIQLPPQAGGSSARFTTTSRSSSRTRVSSGSTTVRPGGGHDGRAPRRSGRSCATTSSAPRHGPTKITARSTLENLAPIGRPTWTIGSCGRGLWRVRRKNGGSAGHIGSSAPSSARTTQQPSGGGDHS